MLINSHTIGTSGSVTITLDGIAVGGVVNLCTKNKYAECYVKDDNGHFVISNDELVRECVPFEIATIRFDNVVIEVH